MSKIAPTKSQATPQHGQPTSAAQSTPTSPTSSSSPMDHCNQVIHVRGDSDSKLEELFNAVMNPSVSLVPLTLPMRQRKFPASFFQPPDFGSRTPASHSRESSTDSTATAAFAGPNSSASSNSNNNGSSNPSTQQEGGGGGGGGGGAVNNGGAAVNNSGPQQSGGSTGAGGATQNTTAGQHSSGLVIHHPRAHSSPASLQQTFASAPSLQHQHLRQQSYDITDDTPLPPGWGMAKTSTGQRYFLNHITQTTTWEDPRKKLPLNTTSAVSLGHIASGGSSAASTPTPSPTPTPTINPLSVQNLGPLPDGLEQATTPEGEVYFINHITRTTSWFDPRIPMHLQRPIIRNPSQQPPNLLGVSNSSGNGGSGSGGGGGGAGNASGNSNSGGGSGTTALPPLPATSSNSDGQFSIQQRQQQVRLQRLQMERERLQLRQREIMMQEMLMQQHLIDALPPTSPAMDLQPSLSTTGLDPFLSGSTGTPTSTDFHSRQESADSGLGMGTNYSHPHTPEGFLSPMDDSSMDTATDAQLAAADLGNLDLGESNNMDSDDLEPSLQVELGNDLLDVDVQELLNTNRMDNVLTWL